MFSWLVNCFWGLLFACFAAHSSLDDHLARWFGLNQSKYQWALDDYYESKGSVSISLLVFLAFRFTFMLGMFSSLCKDWSRLCCFFWFIISSHTIIQSFWSVVMHFQDLLHTIKSHLLISRSLSSSLAKKWLCFDSFCSVERYIF